MKYLLDTCTFLWLTSSPGRLSKRAKKLLQDAEHTLIISDVCALELSFKWMSGKLPLPEPPRMWYEQQTSLWNLEAVPLARNVIYRASELPKIHLDPFDRLLVATALEEGGTILTPDREIAKYPVAVMW